MDKPRAILFDFGNTLLVCQHMDYVGATVDLFNLARNPRGVRLETFAEWLDELRNDLDPLRLSTCLEIPVSSFQRLLYERFEMRFDMTSDQLAWQFWSRAEVMVPAPGVGETLAELAKRHIPLGIVSNFMLPSDVIRRELAKYDLDRHFAFIMTSSEYGVRKPHPALFKVAAGKLNLPPTALWFVGDSLPWDVEGARAVGMIPLWYNPQNTPTADPTLQIHALWDLVDLLSHAA